MEQIEASKLARGLGVVLERVLKGDSFEVIRYGRVVALIVPVGAENLATRREPIQPGTKKATRDPALAPPPMSRREKADAEMLAGSVPKPTLNEAQRRQQKVDELLRRTR